jgi:hypothetical protein
MVMLEATRRVASRPKGSGAMMRGMSVSCAPFQIFYAVSVVVLKKGFPRLC